MSKMKINDFKKNEFYQLPKWILRVKGLKPVDMVLYSLAFNNWKLSEKNGLVNEEEEIYFFMTHETIKKELEIGKDQVIDSIKRLVKSGVIIQERIVGKATRFYLENNLENIEFETTKSTTENPTSSKNPTSRKNRTDQSVKSDHTSTENPTTDQSENTDINNKDSFKKDYLNKTELKTTTKESVVVDELFQKALEEAKKISGVKNHEVYAKGMIANGWTPESEVRRSKPVDTRGENWIETDNHELREKVFRNVELTQEQEERAIEMLIEQGLTREFLVKMKKTQHVYNNTLMSVL